LGGASWVWDLLNRKYIRNVTEDAEQPATKFVNGRAIDLKFNVEPGHPDEVAELPRQVDLKCSHAEATARNTTVVPVPLTVELKVDAPILEVILRVSLEGYIVLLAIRVDAGCACNESVLIGLESSVCCEELNSHNDTPSMTNL
jgi:hypothetical protein